MIINKSDLEHFVAFGMGFSDSISMKSNNNVFIHTHKDDKDKDKKESRLLNSEYYEYGYKTGQRLIEIENQESEINIIKESYETNKTIF